MEGRRKTDEIASSRAAKVENFIKSVRESRLGRSAAKRRRRPAPVATIVQEGSPLPSFRWIVDVDAFVPTPRRRLRPVPAQRPVLTANSRLTPQRLLIQVEEARNVPMRAKRGRKEEDRERGRGYNRRGGGRGRQDVDEEDEELLADMARTSKGGAADRFAFDEDMDLDGLRERSRVSPFVRIAFRDHESRTPSSEGTNARWKYPVSVPLEDLTSDLTPQRLLEMNDNIYISLFDEVHVRPASATRRGAMGGASAAGSAAAAAGEKTQVEQRYLGQLTIPFSTVYKAGRIEGFFKVMTPDVTMGYLPGRKGNRQDSNQGRGGYGGARGGLQGLAGFAGFGGGSLPSPGDGRGRGGPDSPRAGEDDGRGNVAFSTSAADLLAQGASSTYLKVMCTLDPHLPAPNLDMEIVSACETGKLVRHARAWLTKMRDWHNNKEGFESRGDRVFEAMVPNMDGEHVFLPRFLSPTGQAPPSDVLYRWDDGLPPRPPSGDPAYGYKQDVAHCARFVSMIPFLDDFKAFKE